MSPLITSKEDGRMKLFQEYKASKTGFVGYEALLFDSLVAALTRLDNLGCQKETLQPVAGDDEVDR